MEKFSRFLVSLFVVIILQSTLGTNYAKVDLSNAITLTSGGSSQYAKFNNGLLIQFGYITTKGQKQRYVYLPTSFKDAGYRVFFGIEYGSDVVQTLYILNKTTSRFYADGTFYNPETGIRGFPGEAFNWMAIGYWK